MLFITKKTADSN